MARNKFKEYVSLSYRFIVTTVLSIAIVACTWVTKRSGETVLMSEDEFGKYVENVFRYHNQVMNNLIQIVGDGTDPETEQSKALSAAEAKMIEICRPLNDVVAEALSGKSVGLETEMSLVDTVPACEEASHVVDEMIP